MADRSASAMLTLLGDVFETMPLDEFRPALLAALQRAVPSDWRSLNDVAGEPTATVVLVEPPLDRRWHEAFARLAEQNPLVARFRRTGDGRPYRFSDVVSREKLHALELYREIYGPLGLEHQIAFTLPHSAERLLAIALSRRERDFSDEERDLLADARPYLIQAYTNAAEHSRVLDELERWRRLTSSRGRLEALAAALRGIGLSSREAGVVACVALGASNRGVGEALGITERTVEKHLQRCYPKLGVAARGDAARAAWTALDDDIGA